MSWTTVRASAPLRREAHLRISIATLPSSQCVVNPPTGACGRGAPPFQEATAYRAPRPPTRSGLGGHPIGPEVSITWRGRGVPAARAPSPVSRRVGMGRPASAPLRLYLLRPALVASKLSFGQFGPAAGPDRNQPLE